MDSFDGFVHWPSVVIVVENPTVGLTCTLSRGAVHHSRRRLKCDVSRRGNPHYQHTPTAPLRYLFSVN